MYFLSNFCELLENKEKSSIFKHPKVGFSLILLQCAHNRWFVFKYGGKEKTLLERII